VGTSPFSLIDVARIVSAIACCAWPPTFLALHRVKKALALDLIEA
jgi:hypothetical protein